MKKHYSRTLILQPSSKVMTFEQAVENCHQIVDVRSHKEFLEGSIPGAVNLPLFDDDERGVIGTRKTIIYVTLVVIMATISGLVYGLV